MRADRDQLVAGYGFALDAFQVRAMDAWDAGQSVLVAAPTGSGKTVVAEYAIAAALADGRRAFYTAPIKALSNQKFQDLRRRHGEDQVGLLTGDNAINAEAPVVVMTTEVLRNMIYARSASLRDLGVVVLDEVHFLQDAYRGPVWEEVITHLEHHVGLVCLSATVSNADEVAEWISTVRGPTTCVVEDRRPVRLDHLFMATDLTQGRVHLLPTLVRGRPNPEALRIDHEAHRGPRRGSARSPARRKLATPTRLEVVERLAEEAMLPAIYFIFSRHACEQAAAQCLNAGISLTTPEERRRITDVVEARLSSMADDDLEVLGYDRLLAQLQRGIAPHHAGMVPPFKEAVEACFVQGLVKVVFATETLAVGINMPAKSVVVEKLTKFTGEHHSFLTAGEYTQLTGRAGRRGIDTQGQAVVLWSPFVSFEQVATLASSRSFHLNSAFRPTYNMAANLVRSYSAEQAHHLLNLSFAQYQADRDLVRLEARLERRERHLAELREAARSPYGDLEDYRRSGTPSAPTVSWGPVIDAALARLRPGSVIYVHKGSYAGKVAVLTVAARKSGTKVTALTPGRHELFLGRDDFARPPQVLGQVTLPEPFAPQRAEFQRVVAQRLTQLRGAGTPPPGSAASEDRTVVAHPVLADPELDERLKAAAQADRVARELTQLRERVAGRSRSVSRQFDRVLGILEGRGYVDQWTLTEAGRLLSRLFHESDLLIAECLRRGLLDGLDAATLAGMVSLFTYEHRSAEPPPPAWFPSREVARRAQQAAQLSADLRSEEERAGLVPHRLADPSLFAVAFAWASGQGFAEVVADEELSGGDFVRNIKQLIDLMRQIALVAPEHSTRRSAQAASDALFRGVVAASSAVADSDVGQGNP